MGNISNNRRPIIIETPRLYLCEFHDQDAQTFYDMNADPKVLRFTGDIPFDSIEEATAFIKSYDQYKLRGFGRLSVLLRSSGNTIGWCGLKDHGDIYRSGIQIPEIRIGTRGYATEAAKACKDYAFNALGMTELVGRVARENAASIRVLEKIGMTYWRSGECEGIEDARYFRIKNED